MKLKLFLISVLAILGWSANAQCNACFSYVGSPFCQSGTNPSPTFGCGGTAGTFSAAPAGLVIHPVTGVISLAVSAAGTYTVTNTLSSNGGCTATTTVFIGVPATVANAGPNQTVCGTTATLAGNFPNQGTGIWTLISGSGNISNPTLATSGVTGLGTGANIFQWTISNPPCAASSSMVVITVGPATTVASAGPNQAFCGTTATMAGNTPIVGTGVWSLVSGSGNITTPTSPTSGVTALGTGANVFQWTISNPPCASSTSQVTLTAMAATTVSNAGPMQAICGNTCTMAANAASVGTGQWTLISGSGLIANTNSPTTAITGLGVGANVFQWTITHPPCMASSSQVVITVDQTPDVSNAILSEYICSGNTATFNPTSNVMGTTFSFTASASSPFVSGYTSMGNGNINEILVNSGNTAETVTYSFTPIGPGPTNCVGIPVDFVVTIDPTPTAAYAGADQIVCGPNTTLSGNAPTSGSGLWTVISGSGTITTPTSPTTTVTGLGTGNNVFQWTISSMSCGSSSSQVTVSPTPVGLPICEVTVDSLSTHNIVVWEKTGLAIPPLYFKIYREDLTNVYTFLNSVMFDSLSVYNDYGANPNVTGKRYKLSLVDTCYNESALSPYHNTMWLNYAGNGILSWTPYSIEGQSNPVTQYQIYRDDLGNGVWAVIGTTAGTQLGYTDINFASYPAANYKVKVLWSLTCTPTRSALSSPWSNATQHGVGINEATAVNSIIISPNPFTSQTIISFDREKRNETLVIRNVLGKVVRTYTVNGRELTIERGELASGIYFITTGNVNRKIVIE